MRRREFIAFLGGTAAWPLAVRAQPSREANINIGVLTDMTGIFATLAGEGSVVAAHMAVEDSGGEVLGRKIRVLAGDHKHNPILRQPSRLIGSMTSMSVWLSICRIP